ncbi:hypothetical protein GH733_017432 [Mirounga leonina]|nr:hypothetical protein GH733_017432 [Mirounga leonina]
MCARHLHPGGWCCPTQPPPPYSSPRPASLSSTNKAPRGGLSAQQPPQAIALGDAVRVQGRPQAGLTELPRAHRAGGPMCSSPPPSSSVTFSALPPRGQQTEARSPIKDERVPWLNAGVRRRPAHFWAPRPLAAKARPPNLEVAHLNPGYGASLLPAPQRRSSLGALRLGPGLWVR